MAYTSQYVTFIMMALQLSEDRISLTQRNDIIASLHALPANISKVLHNDKALQAMAKDTLEVRFLSLCVSYVLITTRFPGAC
jgi:glucosamine--fructose-6-phosphate aminotransferase (isomerizing)